MSMNKKWKSKQNKKHKIEHGSVIIPIILILVEKVSFTILEATDRVNPLNPTP